MEQPFLEAFPHTVHDQLSSSGDDAGMRLAKTAEAIGMKVIGLNSRSSQAELKALLQTADIVSLHCSLTPKTHHLIG